MDAQIKRRAVLFGLILTFLGVCLILLQTLRPSLAQTVTSVTATNPKYPEYFDPPYQSQLRSLVQGSKAETLGESRVQIQEAKVQQFQTNGQTELLIEAPQCIYDRVARTVTSAGPLHAQTGDGKFMIDGTGFIWWQTNMMLIISNRVHTFVQADLLQSGSNQPAGAMPKVGDLEIASQRFVYDRTNGFANYIGEATVTSTNLAIKGGSLLLIVPSQERQLQSITVETNVVMDYEKVHIEGQHATYVAQTGIARVSGHPTWRAEDRQGHADELVVDRTNKVFRANGQAYLTFSALGMTNAGFIPSQRVVTTNASPITNRFVEISSDFYEIRTNVAKFGDHVALTETTNGQRDATLNCGTLNVTFTGTNELQSMVAETNVLIRRDTDQLAADRATYTATTGDLELTGNPSWQSGDRKGRGNLILINSHREDMLVRGDASMRLPAKELGESSLAPDQTPKSAGLDKPEEFADVYAEEYMFKPASARFERRVRIVHPSMNWTCDRVGVQSADAQGKNVTILAEGSVIFALSADNRPLHGTCDRAEYVNNLTSEPVVDRIELTGNPILETTNAVVRNSIIIIDKTQHKIFLPGEYAISGTSSALGTNGLQVIP